MFKIFSRINLKNPYTKHLLIILGILLSLQIFFYPSFYTTTDEREYIENSYLITQGDLVRQNSECYDGAYCGYFNGIGYISKYNLGLSLLLIPFTTIDWRLSFILIFIFFAIGVITFQKILKN